MVGRVAEGLHGSREREDAVEMGKGTELLKFRLFIHRVEQREGESERSI